MTRDEFEALLDTVCDQLGNELQASTKYHGADEFQQRVFNVMRELATGQNLDVDPTFHPHAFPDIHANGFGVEVKTTVKDSWLSVGNSVFEGMRDPDVQKIYVVFGKMGGMPSVKWGRYEDRITHVRISHAPRFVLEMDKDSSLFGKMNIAYEDFARLTPHGKMQHVRDYSRGRLKPGERLWWLEDVPGEQKTLPVEVRLYMSLEPEEKLRYRGEASLLCPEIVKGSRAKNKYNNAALYLLTVHGIFCTQTRDLFSAGSAAGKERGGNYVLRALKNVETQMREAAAKLSTGLIEEYWGEAIEPPDRIKEWLKRADGYAKDWKPSDHLFLEGK